MDGALPAVVVLFAQREGSVSWAEVTAAGKASVARLTEQIQEKLPSLRDKDPSDLTLHVAEVDDVGEVLSVTATALPSRRTLAEVGLANGASIIVKVSIAAGELYLVQLLHCAACRVSRAAFSAALTLAVAQEAVFPLLRWLQLGQSVAASL